MGVTIFRGGVSEDPPMNYVPVDVSAVQHAKACNLPVFSPLSRNKINRYIIRGVMPQAAPANDPPNYVPVPPRIGRLQVPLHMLMVWIN